MSKERKVVTTCAADYHLIGNHLYTFMGERLIQFKVTDIVDEERIEGDDETNTYTFYKDHCYQKIEDAILGMLSFLERITKEFGIVS